VDIDEPRVACLVGCNRLDTFPTDIESPASVLYRGGAGNALRIKIGISRIYEIKIIFQFVKSQD